MTSTETAEILEKARAIAVENEHSGMVAMIDAGDIRAAHLTLLMHQFDGDYETPSVRDWAMICSSDREGFNYHVETSDTEAQALREIAGNSGDWVPEHIIDLRTNEGWNVELVGVATTPMMLGEAAS